MSDKDNGDQYNIDLHYPYQIMLFVHLPQRSPHMDAI